MKKTAQTSVPILPVLAERWSPRAYDSSYALTDEQVLAILEAGRWAPSANNAQPWFFSVVKRGDGLFEKVCEVSFEGFNAAWAPNASAFIVVSVAVNNPDGTPRKWSHYDAGLAAMSMVIQAEALGLATHQIGGFKANETAHALGIAAQDVVPAVMLVIGKAAEPTTLEGPAYEREIAERTRKALSEIVLHGLPN